MIIKKWLRDGEHNLEDSCDHTEDLIAAAGRLMDKAYAQDIVGEILFEGEDGKMYVGVTTFQILEASPEYVEDMMEE